jgi:SAM-dependent methyltransferase
VSDQPDFTICSDSSVYYEGRYWNDFPQTLTAHNRIISGDPDVRWYEQFARTTEGRRFKKALFLNCGNGWVDRDFFYYGLVEDGVGIDISPDLLEDARAKAETENLSLRYYQANINESDFPEDGFDLIVNHAAAHHIAYLDRVFRSLCASLPEDGVFVSYDYIGPHRNQYPPKDWEAASEFNEQLPRAIRQEMSYPHLPTMLATDPTEAIHSELILSVFKRYFTLEEFTPIGGSIAYLLLTHNKKLFGAEPELRDEWVEYVLHRDNEYREAHPDQTLFAYFWGRPNKGALEDHALLARWTHEEEERESRARENNGVYYELTELQKEHMFHRQRPLTQYISRALQSLRQLFAGE